MEIAKFFNENLLSSSLSTYPQLLLLSKNTSAKHRETSTLHIQAKLPKKSSKTHKGFLVKT